MQCFQCYQPSLELQSAFARCISKRFDATVKQKSATIKYHAGNASLLGSFGYPLANISSSFSTKSSSLNLSLSMIICMTNEHEHEHEREYAHKH